MTTEFTLTVSAYDAREPAAGGYFDLRARVACRSYSGETSFWLAGRDLDRFLTDLANLNAGQANSAQLLGGWKDPEERLRLRLSPAGRSGQYTARVKIATNGPRTDQWQRVETEFVCPRDAFGTFLEALQHLAEQRAPGDATLAGDGDAIA